MKVVRRDPRILLKRDQLLQKGQLRPVAAKVSHSKQERDKEREQQRDRQILSIKDNFICLPLAHILDCI